MPRLFRQTKCRRLSIGWSSKRWRQVQQPSSLRPRPVSAACSHSEQLQVFNELKILADKWMRAELQRCLALCACMQALAEATGQPEHMAITLRAQGNAYAIGQADFQRGLQAYDRAAEIYAGLDDPVRQAESLIGKLCALMNLGLYEQAFSEGEWARQVLRENEEWLTLARLKTNLALLHSRLGNDAQALELLDLAREAYQQLGVEGEAYWPRGGQPGGRAAQPRPLPGSCPGLPAGGRDVPHAGSGGVLGVGAPGPGGDVLRHGAL